MLGHSIPAPLLPLGRSEVVKLLGIISQIVPKRATNPSMATTPILGSRSQQGNQLAVATAAALWPGRANRGRASL